MKNYIRTGLILSLAITSACEQKYAITRDLPNSDICIQFPDAAACNKAPAVTTPGVVTILFTMSQIPQGSGTLILANAIKFASPKSNPKILYLADSDLHGEDVGDADYIKNTLLLGYDVEYNVILSGGLSPSLVAGKDLVIVHNPGHPLQDKKTFNTLKAFEGGVILIGDDMSKANGVSAGDMEAFTGLHHDNNGTSMTCGGQTYPYDNLHGYFYRVAMGNSFFPGIPQQYKNYEYGNDIDHTQAVNGTEVLATAQAAPHTCNIGLIPAVVRRPK